MKFEVSWDLHCVWIPLITMLLILTLEITSTSVGWLFHRIICCVIIQ